MNAHFGYHRGFLLKLAAAGIATPSRCCYAEWSDHGRRILISKKDEEEEEESSI